MDAVAGFDVNIQSVALATIGLTALFLIIKGLLLPKNVVDSLLLAKDQVIESQAHTIEVLTENAAKPTEKLLTVMHDRVEGDASSDGT